MSGRKEKIERFSRIFASGFVEIIGRPVICTKTLDISWAVHWTIPDLYILATNWFPTLQRFLLEVRCPDNNRIWSVVTQFRLNEQFILIQNLCGMLKKKKESGDGFSGQ